ncbi:aldehyde dehydrogenase family protein [Duganella sp. FT92W]|uniref:Aldehyde dehydrogenase family protein n=1 Tax=Pseudoduganella rivuli TaxID=2666085 RepID=A0A7X2IQ41_9BURK|nr:aldehyde dehydrogenase family protein [Pseudoduganella rivuli]
MTIHESTPAQINGAVTAASRTAGDWAQSGAERRAALLRGLAEALHAQRETLVRIANEETSLPLPRLNGELDRTIFQLHGFADQVVAGRPYAVTEDAAVAGAPPQGRPHLARVQVPLGPVAMFSASNFPFAFSVLGGDTASALAAGCPVVVKAHPGHPALSRAVHELAQAVLARQDLPAGLIGMVEGAGIDVGVALVQHPEIAAVAFTGSYKGGHALWQLANARPRPIPFYGELGSINPVVMLPAALAGQATDKATALADSMAFSSGQACTSPGVIVLFDDADADAFETALRDALKGKAMHPMLTAGMKRNFDAGVARVVGTPGVETVLAGADAGGESAPPQPLVARTTAANFIAQHALQEEVFGPACVLVRVASADDVVAVLRAVGGSLTVTVWGAQQASSDAQAIVRAAQQIAGRVLFSGVPTGVAVAASQVHGGPWPSSTQPAATSVGYAAMDRFLRPVAMQDAPAWLMA